MRFEMRSISRALVVRFDIVPEAMFLADNAARPMPVQKALAMGWRLREL